MKLWCRWGTLYIAILALAFSASFTPSTASTLFANAHSIFSPELVTSTVYSNTVSYPTTIKSAILPPLHRARRTPLTVFLQNGKVLVAGGDGEQSGDFLKLASTGLYDPATNQWGNSGDLGKGRSEATITLLNSGKVLVTGGAEDEQTSAELFDPVSRSWSSAGTMNSAHFRHTATLLTDGKVLVAGGTVTSTEIYDPSDGSWTPTGNMNVARIDHSATLLPNGQVLVVGGADGSSSSTAELYDPATETWSYAAPMNDARTRHASLLLQNGKLLVAGGSSDMAEVYDPATDEWDYAGSTHFSESNSQFMFTMSDGNILMLNNAQYWVYDPITQNSTDAVYFDYLSSGHNFESYTAIQLSTTAVFVAGGMEGNFPTSSKSVRRMDYHQLNDFSASLTLPSEWITQENAQLSFRGITTAAPLQAASLRNEDGTQGVWMPVVPGETVTTTWNFGNDSPSKKVFLSLQDSNDHVRDVITATVRVDRTPPVSLMRTPKPTNATVPGTKYSPATFTVAWQGSDATSGIAGYDLQVKKAGDADWTPLLANSTLSQTTYTGENEETYFFRLRALDVAGNVEAWPQSEDASTQVDAEAPIGFVDIATVGQTSVLLLLDATDNLSGVSSMKVGLIDEFESAMWENYATPKTLSFDSPSPSQFAIYVQYRDLVGNLSTVYCVAYGGAECPAAFEIALPYIRRQ